MDDWNFNYNIANNMTTGNTLVDSLKKKAGNKAHLINADNLKYHLRRLELVHPWWMELREGVHPYGYKFWRKTKAGKWELVATITEVQNINLIYNWFGDMWEKEMQLYPEYAAMKVTTFNDRQIYSTYYHKLYGYLTYLAFKDASFGISINKGEDYLICHNDLPGNNLKPIADYFRKLARKHKGIKAFHKAKFDESDNELYWGWLTFNDGYKISVAVDADFSLYKEYESNLQVVDLSHLIKL